MSNTKKWFFYLAYTSVMMAFFLYYLFPSDTVKTYISSNLNQINPDLNIYIDTIKPVFPPGIRLRSASLYYADDALIDAETITVEPALLAFFQKRTAISFKGSMLEGNFKGNAEIITRPADQEAKIDVSLSGIRISDISGMQQLTDRKISGKLDGKIEYRQQGTSETITTDLILTDGMVELIVPVLTLESITFKKIEAELILNGQTLQIKKCLINGHEMDGDILGSIKIKQPPGSSVLNLRGTIKPQRSFIADLRQRFPVDLLPKNIMSKNGFPITLKGTIEKPSFSLQ